MSSAIANVKSTAPPAVRYSRACALVVELCVIRQLLGRGLFIHSIASPSG